MSLGVKVTEPLSSSGRCLQSHFLTTAIFAGFTILPGTNVPQYYSRIFKQLTVEERTVT
jgi:hypothetical protein